MPIAKESTSQNPAYQFFDPPVSTPLSPVFISCPHTGVYIPSELSAWMPKQITRRLPDTDWYVDKLYDFAPSLGVSLIKAEWSRYVIDLNRSPEDKPLYKDGRIETGLYPQDTFHGEPLFLKETPLEKIAEIRQRALKEVYHVYHQKLQTEIQKRKARFTQCLVWEAHSIARNVPRIRKEPFGDIMIGNSMGKSSNEHLTKVLFEIFSESFDTRINDPFSGGFITRNYANLKEGVMCIQIEMSQDLYLLQTDSGFPELSPKAGKLRSTLKKAFLAALEALKLETHLNS